MVYGMCRYHRWMKKADVAPFLIVLGVSSRPPSFSPSTTGLPPDGASSTSRYPNHAPRLVSSCNGGGELHNGDFYLSATQLIRPTNTAVMKSLRRSLSGRTIRRVLAVCLSEFKEGEDVRLLPECLHYFDVGCIDVWLHSHSSCPLYRTTTLVTLSAGCRPILSAIDVLRLKTIDRFLAFSFGSRPGVPFMKARRSACMLTSW